MHRMSELGRCAGIEQSALRYQPSPAGSQPPMKLVFVEDDDTYREVVTAELGDEGFSVVPFASGEAMFAGFESGIDADVVILDWGLGTTVGPDVLSEMRERGIVVPVVFLTARCTAVHERLALQQGAVDFIDKSRGTDVLAARLRLIRDKRHASPSRHLFRCGDLVLNMEANRAFWNGIDINLTLTEFKIVYLIASHSGEYVTYRKLYDTMHYEGFVAGSGEHGYRANVRSSIKRIREKFRECDARFDGILNYTGFGYCWSKRLP
jgi:two-component system response regulator ChvI